jgi:hypothetical protein
VLARRLPVVAKCSQIEDALRGRLISRPKALGVGEGLFCFGVAASFLRSMLAPACYSFPYVMLLKNSARRCMELMLTSWKRVRDNANPRWQSLLLTFFLAPLDVRYRRRRSRGTFFRKLSSAS